MNGLRVLATVTALAIGLGGLALAMASIPASLLNAQAGPPPSYAWGQLLGQVIAPVTVCTGGATALLLLARVDRRLEWLQRRSESS